MFTKFQLAHDANIFDQLYLSTKFEDVAVGRKGAVIIDNAEEKIPLVRTTTNYSLPLQKFQPIHRSIIEKIQLACGNSNIVFNNALIEIYDSNYRTMGWHSDQALDLGEESFICIFSCYSSEDSDIRKLKIKSKTAAAAARDIPLDNNSIVFFSIDTNKKYQHKIILETVRRPRCKWLGITFRQSKTFVQFIDERVFFVSSGEELTAADEQQKKDFYRCRRKENTLIEYSYPNITYTISRGDLLQPRS